MDKAPLTTLHGDQFTELLAAILASDGSGTRSPTEVASRWREIREAIADLKHKEMRAKKGQG